MEEKLKLNDEFAMLQNLAKKNILEINKINSFFKIFRSLFEEQINSLNNKLKDFNLDNNNSVLSVYLNDIIEYYKKFISDYKNNILKIQNELINSIESFKTNQDSIYKENNNELNELILYFNNNQKILNNSIFNYYKSYYNAQEEEKNLIKKKKANININEDESELLIKDKMEARNNEMIYKYDIEKYNKELDNIIDKYLKIKLKIETAEKGRISFIKASFDKQKSVFKNISNLINNYIEKKENFSDEFSKKIEKEKINEISKLSEDIKKSIKLKTKKFVSAELIFNKQENY